MRRLVLATNNPHKVREIRAILADTPCEILSCEDFTGLPELVESGATLAENAILKARAIYAVTGEWTLADDSGLEIDALNSAPGVMSARFAGTGCTFADNNAKTLRLMEHVAEEQRTARFRCVAALVIAPEQVETFDGVVEGAITRREMGQGGFGYDPIFFTPELGCTFAEASAGAKNRISHRARAFRKVARRLRELLG